MYRLNGINLSKRFGARKVFNNINFELTTGDCMAITGPNGSGKSTLVMTLLGAYLPSKGEVTYCLDDEFLPREQIRRLTSLVSPYLNLYEDLTGEENLVFFSTVSGANVSGNRINDLLIKVGLEGRGVDQVRSYSSGMKQRLKYAVALLGEPAFLFLDEPTSNLDSSGKQIVRDIVEEYKSLSVVIIATNEEEELALANQICKIDQ